MNITNLTLIETLEALKRGDFSEEELNQAYQERIEKLNPELNAYLEVVPGDSGIPMGVKDVISTKEIKTTAGSKILEGYVPPFNATVIDRLSENGISVIGKTNMDELAMGSSGENSAYGVTKNPWDLNKVPGGTSSGSAAAVAADLAVFALGSDTGGSIRQPASFCGVVGLKPTYGRVSRYGLISAVSSFDTIGPITKCVEDAALVLDWISGGDEFDNNSNPEKFTMQPERLKSGVKGLKVGVPKEYFAEGLDPEVEKVIKDAIKKLEELGAEIVEVSLPNSKYAIAAYYIINPSEISSNLARFDGIRFGETRDKFGPEVKRRIMLGTFALSSGYYDAYFTKAAKVRTLIKQDFEEVFEKVDVVIGPVAPTLAWNIGEKIDDPLKMYLGDIYTVSANLAGIPAMSIPCGFVEGLPVGMQILGKWRDEETILRVGYAYEKATEWHERKPELDGGRGKGDGDE